MKLRVSTREQRTLALVGALGLMILWVYLALIIGPLMREARRSREQVRAARDQLRVLELATMNETALREQHRQVQDTVASLRSLLPDEEELPRVIELLSELAGRSQVKIQTIFPQRPLEAAGAPKTPAAQASPAPVVYKEVLIQVDALAGYHQLGTFLSLVEAGEKPMQLASLQIAPEPRGSKRFHIKLVIQSYFATRDAVTIGGGKKL